MQRQIMGVLMESLNFNGILHFLSNHKSLAVVLNAIYI